MRKTKAEKGKKYKVILFMILCTAVFTSCADSRQEKKPEKTVITLWYYWDIGHNQRELGKLIDAFNNIHEKIEIEARYVPDEDFKKQLALSIADGTMPDIAMIDSADFRFFNHMTVFADLTDEIEGINEYDKKALASCTVDGRVLGLPFGLNCPALFYNEEMLRQEGIKVPETWEEFYHAAVKLSKQGKYGFAMTALSSEESLYSFLPVLWSMGGDANQINSKESRDAFVLLKRLIRDGGMGRQSISLTMGDLMKQFAKGNIAMMINSPMMVQPIREENPKLVFDVAKLPTNGENVSVVGGEVFGVTDGSHKEEAIQFLKFLAEKERMASYIDSFGFLAPREDVRKNQFLDDPVLGKFLTIYKTARTREFTEKWPNVSLIISGAMQEVIIGTNRMDEILGKAAENIRRVREGGV